MEAIFLPPEKRLLQCLLFIERAMKYEDEIHLTLRELFGYVAQLVVQISRSPFFSAD
jgi:hypothetical protein